MGKILIVESLGQVNRDGVPLLSSEIADLKPTEEYLGYIVKGLDAHPDASAQYRDAMAATETCVPGRYVSTYFREHGHNQAGWAQALIDSYQRLALVIFLNVIYRYSLTALLIRPGSG